MEWADGLNLINRLNDFYRFDHNIFLIDSSLDLDQWLPTSATNTKLGNLTPQTVYVFDDLSQQTVLRETNGKNTFLVVVVNDVNFEWLYLLTEVKTIRALDVNVRTGVFFARHITSLHPIEQLFRVSWTGRIFNIFSAFHLSADDNGPSSFNVFKYDPFGTFDLINVTSSNSLPDYFSNKVPNYRKDPLRVTKFRGFGNGIDTQFCEAIASVLNASMSLTTISFGSPMRGDMLLHEQRYSREYDIVYPHRQTMEFLIVPHAQPYSDFFAYLQNGTGTWTLLFVYIVIVIMASSLLLIISGYLHKKKIFIFQSVTDVVNLLMNDNAAIRYRGLHRADICVTVPLTFTGLIVINGILSIFQSYITSPIYQPQINSLKDLYESSVPIFTSEIHDSDKVTKLLEERYGRGGWIDKVHEIDVVKLTKKMRTFNYSMAFFLSDGEAQGLFEVQKRLGLKAYHLLSDNFAANPLVSFRFRPDFPFIGTINELIHRLNGAGLIDRWVNEENLEAVAKVMKKRNDARMSIDSDLDMAEFAVPTVVWFGWTVSGVVFLCEMIWYKVQKWGNRALKISKK